MSKYYTPEINEFYNGFRFEADSPNSWINEKWDNWNKYVSRGRFVSLLKTKAIRVKYLDKNDIEELGWLETKGLGNCSEYVFKDYRMILGEGAPTLILKSLEDTTSLILFRGRVKNISELEILMRQLDVK